MVTDIPIAFPVLHCHPSAGLSSASGLSSPLVDRLYPVRAYVTGPRGTSITSPPLILQRISQPLINVLGQLGGFVRSLNVEPIKARLSAGVSAGRGLCTRLKPYHQKQSAKDAQLGQENSDNQLEPFC